MKIPVPGFAMMTVMKLHYCRLTDLSPYVFVIGRGDKHGSWWFVSCWFKRKKAWRIIPYDGPIKRIRMRKTILEELIGR